MTKKDYERLAQLVRYTRQNISDEMPEDYLIGFKVATRIMAHNMCTALQLDNPRFDRERFLKACGIE